MYTFKLNILTYINVAQITQTFSQKQQTDRQNMINNTFNVSLLNVIENFDG